MFRWLTNLFRRKVDDKPRFIVEELIPEEILDGDLMLYNYAFDKKNGIHKIIVNVIYKLEV